MKRYSLSSLLLASTTALVMAGQAAAQEADALSDAPEVLAQELAINYDVNMGGLTLGSGRFRATFTDDAYVATTNLNTNGLAEWLFSSTYATVSQGDLVDDAILPSFYTSDFDGHGDEYQLVRIGYEETTPFLEMSDPSYGPRIERFPVSDEEREGSFDPLNAAIHLITGMAFSEEHPCGETIQIFDGRRRYNLNMTYQGTDEINVRNGEVWDGEVIVCGLAYEEVAGFKPQPEDDELPRPPLTIFIGSIEDGRYHVPLRVRAPTPLGSMVMIATHYRVTNVMDQPNMVNVTGTENLAPTE